ncbi:MAG: hypothetical protein IT385_07450 [Deltaproteobacteria bacterium]|nr:hypothetical protein [Deltaproteobacteria bacterium]
MPAVFAALVAATVGHARAEPNTDGRRMLGICQRVLGEDLASCVARTAFSVTKTIDQELLEQPNRQAVAYVVRVVEGNTRYALSMTSLVTLTGLASEGTVVNGLVASLQKRSPGDEGFTTVASALVGAADPACGCPFVGSADLAVTLRDDAGLVIEPGEGALVELLDYAADLTLQLDATYDLAAGIVLPGDEVRLQACVQWAVADEADLPGCFADGGGTRVARACTDFDFEAYADPESATVDLVDMLRKPAVDWIALNGFRALSASPTVTPRDTPLTLTTGVGAAFVVAATGLPGTESVIAVTGDVSCGQRVSCEPGASLCFGELWNDATLDFNDDRGTITASAVAEVVCRPFQCLPGDVAACDDGDPCTIDGCAEGVGCTHVPHAGACDDGDPCTTGETCETGACTGGGPTVCPGASACVEAWCDAELGCRTRPAPNRTKCEDEDLCTVDDECIDGVCRAGAPRDCDDDNVCTSDGCHPLSGCTNGPVTDGASCSDGDVCTDGDRCVGGGCVAGAAKGCDDGNPCTIDRCDPQVAGGCVHDPAPPTTTCEDGNACTTNDTCKSGQCKGGLLRSCDDQNPCTTDRCDPATGCYSTPATGPCDDGTACSTTSACLDGQCRATALLDCDDDNPCTLDTCDAALGCQHAAVADHLACDDRDPCTAGDQCLSGTCVPSGVTACDDGEQCTESTCLDDVGCVHLARSGPCEDGDRCTGPDACDGGTCLAGDAIVCDDHNPCTVDACHPATGCAHTPIDAGGCDDGDPCTSPGVCKIGRCEQQQPVVCDDGNDCTADRCEPGEGCVAPPIGGSCDDHDACTGEGTCAGGVCQAGPALTCDDGNDCTADHCRAGVGCQNVPRDQVPCDDGDPCTTGDTCVTGTCVAPTPLDCDDDNPCTDDVCTPTGCTHHARTGACEDGDLCTTGDQCVEGTCVTGAPKACSDGNTCTWDACDPRTGGCIEVPASDGTVCEDGDACSGCVWPESEVVAGWYVADAVADPALFSPPPPAGVLDLAGFDRGLRVVMTAEPDLRFVQLSSTTAALRGNVRASGVTWRVEIPLTWRAEGPAGQGTTPFRELPSGWQTTVWTDHWRYWHPGSAASMTSSTGEKVTLAVDPTYGSLPLQMGARANGRNLLPGLAWPLRWTRAGVTGSGVLRGTIDREHCQRADTCDDASCVAGSPSTACRSLAAGDYCTYTDADLGAYCKPGQESQMNCVLQANFARVATERPLCSSQFVYAFGFSSSGGTSYRRYAFNSFLALEAFLPTAGAFSTTANDYCNPTAVVGNRFVSRAIALDLSIALSDLGLTPRPHGISLGELTLTSDNCAGYSLRELVHRAEMVAVGVRPPGDLCWDSQTIENTIQTVVLGFRHCLGVPAGVGLPD